METRISVSPQLGSLLEARQMSVAELLRRIEGRYGLAVDPKTLYRLTRPEPVQRADLNIAAAAAAVLDVGLDEMFKVSEVSANDIGPGGPDAAPAIARRLSELFAAESVRDLNPDEETELQTRLSEYARAQVDFRVQQIAKKRGISVEEARRDLEAAVDSVERDWNAFQKSPRVRAAKLRRKPMPSTSREGETHASG